jgi:ATP-binding cassette subfamily B protein
VRAPSEPKTEKRWRPRSVTPAEKAQARQVSLRRIGRLFADHRGELAAVTAIIVASSVIAMATPFLLRTVIDRALPERDLTLLVQLVVGMVAVAAVTAVLGVVQTWISTRVGQEVMHRLRADVFATCSASRSRSSPAPHR